VVLQERKDDMNTTEWNGVERRCDLKTQYRRKEDCEFCQKTDIKSLLSGICIGMLLIFGSTLVYNLVKLIITKTLI